MLPEKRIYLLDGLALIYRAYFAAINSPRKNSKGLNTATIYGFITLLIDLLGKYKPTHMAVVFEPDEYNGRRTTLYPGYTTARHEMPDEITASIPYIEKLITAFNVAMVAMDDHEADDVIGTLATKASLKGYTSYMVSNNKEYAQLVDKLIFWQRPGRLGNPEEILGVNEVIKKFKIKNPRQVVDVLSLKAIDERQAQKFIYEYGSIEGLLANIDRLTGKIKDTIIAIYDTAQLAKKLITINTHAPVDFNEPKCRVGEWDNAAIKELLYELELNILANRILPAPVVQYAKPKAPALLFTVEEPATTTWASKKNKTVDPSMHAKYTKPRYGNFKVLADVPHQYFNVTEKLWRQDLLAELLQQNEICLDTETTSLDVLEAEIVGISFCYKKGQAFYIPLPPDRNKAKTILAEFKPVFESETIVKIGQNIKYDMHILKNYDCEICGPIYDTMLAHYIIKPDGRHGMDYLSETYLQYTPIPTSDLIGTKGKNQGSMRDVDIPIVAEYCNEDTDITFQLKHILAPQVTSINTDDIFTQIEMPLVPILCEMERTGVKINQSFLANYSNQLMHEAARHESAVYELAGEKFNLASPKQLGEVLFDRMKLDPNAKRTRTGQYATGEEVLIKFANDHQIIRDILEFRELTKLKSTYIDALPLLINAHTGRVHTSYQQAVAVTGRLSSQAPNLQNIPIRTKRAKEIRKAFIARDDDHVIISADYSQIELRIMAAASGDINMCEAFIHGIDIHAATAAKVFSVSVENVTKEMRHKAKSVNFGIIYGQGAVGLAENLGISRAEGKDLIDHYWQQYGSVKKYMDAQIMLARKNGFVQTFMGRKRWLADINSSNFAVRAFAERNAVNMPIQGSAADMIKLAMIKITAALKKENLKSKMVLQVHDELVFDALKEEIAPLRAIILDNMQTAMPLPNNVPVVAEIGVGDNWLEAH